MRSDKCINISYYKTYLTLPQIVELLLRSNLCQKLLEDSPTDTLDNNRTTCIHLAARGGHSDIIK